MIKVKMNLTKETKGTFRFDSVSPADKKLITCLYINKEAYQQSNENPPAQITVVVE